METTSKTPKWLRRLQQESWNLELLISGFSIFLLFQGREMIEELLNQLNVHYIPGPFKGTMLILFIICYLGSNVLIFNLILHILLRGFWIGAIGLSSVVNKRDFSTLRYTEKFTNRLNQKVPPLERLIVRLDNFCSTIFAFTFLIVLMLISFFYCLQQHYQIYLNDSLYHQTDFYFFEQNNDMEEKGLKTILDIAHLPRGKNLLKIKRKDFDGSEMPVERDYVIIPFWKE